MSSERTKQRLASQTSKNSVNENTFLKINLEGTERLLPTNEINHIVNVADQFEKERQSCNFYKILGTINPIVSNCLFNLSDSSDTDNYTYAVFNRVAPINFLSRSYPADTDLNDEEDLTYVNSLKYYLKERDGWFGYYDPDVSKKAFCNFIDMEPKRERFSFLLDYRPYKNTTNLPNVKNWELTITYPSSNFSAHTMVQNGLLIIDVETVTISERQMTAFAVACKHNLKSGDTVKITGTGGLNNFNGEHTVYSIGLPNGDLKDYYFVIDLPNTGTISSNSRFKKVIDGIESIYYFRKFKKIKTKSSPVIETDDYETYQTAFSQNNYNDSIIQFVFNEEIDTTDLVDNLGRPLSELYLSIIKTSSNNLFTEVKSGIECPFIPILNNSDSIQYLRDIPVIQKIHNGGANPFDSHNPIESNVNINLNEFFGDLVEYNAGTLNEVVLADIQHRFNTNNRQIPNQIIQQVVGLGTDDNPNLITAPLNLGPRQEGYYYQAHYKIPIRTFSNYIEDADPIVDEIPSYAVERPDGKYIWRDIQPIGFNDGDEETLDYPFLNGSHYRYQNYMFKLKRQDPYGNWGLIYTDFPSDKLGDRITNRFNVNSSDDVC